MTNTKQERIVRTIMDRLRLSMPDVGLLKVGTSTSDNGNFLFVLTYEGTSGAGETVQEAQANLRARLPLAKDRMLAQAAVMERVAAELRVKADDLGCAGLAELAAQAKDILAAPTTGQQEQEKQETT